MTKEALKIFEQGRMPFTLAFCEKPTPVTITGKYNEQKEIWEGLTSSANLTLTLTIGQDRDMD